MPSPEAVATFLKLANKKFPTVEDGQDLLEYALLVALIVLVAVGAVSAVGSAIYTVFWQSIATNF
jgi:Flp pilus assembly pilin Flp